MVLWRDLWAKAIATPMDATVGCLWAEGIADEILFFWRGQRLLAFTRSNWIDDCGRQCRHPPAEPSRGVARPAHCRSSTLLRVLGVAYRAAPSMAASAQSIYAAVSSGLGPQPCHVDGSCADADYGARLFFYGRSFCARVVTTIQLRRALPAAREPADHDRCCNGRRGEE